MNEIELFRGDDRTLEFTVRDGDNVIVNLTGATAKFSVRENFNGCLLFQKTTVDSLQIVVTDPLNGVLEVYLIPADTQEMKTGDYVYDLEVTLPSGKVYTVAQSTFSVKGDVTY